MGSGIGSRMMRSGWNQIVWTYFNLDEIRQSFDGQVRAVIPLFDSDVRGVPMLERAGAALFG